MVAPWRPLLLLLALTGAATPLEAAAPRFTFQLQNDEAGDAYFREISWVNAQNTTKRVVWDEQGRYGPAWSRYYLHSYRPGAVTGAGWFYITNDNVRHDEVHAAINYTVVNQSASQVTMRAEASGLRVTDVITFSGNRIDFAISIENRLNEPVTAEIPIYFSALQVGSFTAPDQGINLSDSNIAALNPREGGRLIEDFNDTGGQVMNYPYDIGVFSPIAAFTDDNISIGMQYVSRIEAPSYVKFYLYPRAQFDPLIDTRYRTQLAANETKTVNVTLQVSDGNDWQGALTAYKNWFESQYGTTPQYCPTGGFAYFVGSNAQCFNTPRLYNAWVGSQCYDPNYPENRFYPGTDFLDVWGKALPNIRALGLERYGVWQASVHSSHLSPLCATCNSCTAGNCPPQCDNVTCEFSPNAELIDPALDIGQDPDKIRAAVEAFRAAGSRLFWYMRTCSDIVGADILNRNTPNPTFVPGTYVDVLDLRDTAVRDRQFAKFDFLAQQGIEDFYIDFLSCPGEDEFMQYVKTEINRRYGFTPQLIREGTRDRDLLIAPGAPLVKMPVYHYDNLKLAAWLLPKATLYGGYFNSFLTDPEYADFLAKGHQPVISGSLFETNPQIIEQFQERLCIGYENQLSRQQSYGAAMGCQMPPRPVYCPAPLAPPPTPPAASLVSAISFPNPVKTTVTIRATANDHFQGNVSVYSQDGALLLRKAIAEATLKSGSWVSDSPLDTSSLTSGIYVYVVDAGDAGRKRGRFAVIR